MSESQVHCSGSCICLFMFICQNSLKVQGNNSLRSNAESHANIDNCNKAISNGEKITRTFKQSNGNIREQEQSGVL